MNPVLKSDLIIYLNILILVLGSANPSPAGVKNITNQTDNTLKVKLTDRVIYVLTVLGLIGFIDAFYLTIKYYSQTSVFCSILNNGCDLVTSSRYATIGGVPIALAGTVYYIVIFWLAFSLWRNPLRQTGKFLLLFSAGGFLFSLWLLYLQIFIIRALCFYCIISAAASTLIFIISLIYSLKNNENE